MKKLTAALVFSLTVITTVRAQQFTMEQTLSDQAQLTTIAFDGLAFLTGSLGADSFFPPGKVADFWGFQYLRDNDLTEMGHNTSFLTSAAYNMLNVLTIIQQLTALATLQVDSINLYGYKRFVLMKAFRDFLEGNAPAGTNGLNRDSVKAFSSELYQLDGRISYQRARVMGNILFNLTASQESHLDSMAGVGMLNWPEAEEPSDLRGIGHDEKVAVMTYAGDLLSWYLGSLDADIYFCPERQGTYFGSFYMKDAPAVGNPDYSIGTNLTADYGNKFLDALTPFQASLITNLVEIQRPYLLEIVDRRSDVSTLLRVFSTGAIPDSTQVMNLMGRYGELDGEIVYNMATNFAAVKSMINSNQIDTLFILRHEVLGDFNPTGAYLFSSPIAIPAIQNTDFLFTEVPENRYLDTTTVGSSESAYYNAYNSIIVSGGGTNVEFQSGSTANLIAGVSVILLPGFHAFVGSSVHAYITLDSTFCDGAAMETVVTAPTSKSLIDYSITEIQPVDANKKSLKIFPNPNNGNFTIEFSNLKIGSEIRVFNLMGKLVYRSFITDMVQQNVNIGEKENGFYLVKITDGKELITEKMVINK
jgi:hypothetical protein